MKLKLLHLIVLAIVYVTVRTEEGIGKENKDQSNEYLLEHVSQLATLTFQSVLQSIKHKVKENDMKIEIENTLIMPIYTMINHANERIDKLESKLVVVQSDGEYLRSRAILNNQDITKILIRHEEIQKGVEELWKAVDDLRNIIQKPLHLNPNGSPTPVVAMINADGPDNNKLIENSKSD